MNTCVLAREVGARYLIVTHDNFYNAVLPLAQWKHKKGMRTKLVRLSETGSSAIDIRNYIVSAYNTWQIPPEYILLVGAPNYVPFTTVSGTYSDNYYTNITGDLYNEILSGRLTVHSLTEAQTVINKILLYERTPYMTDPSWITQACCIVNRAYDPDDSIYWSDTYHAADLMITNGFTDIDTLSNYFGHNTSNVIASVNSGRSILMYRGAGVNNWYSPFNVDPNQTQNGSRLPIVLSITCRTIGTGSTPAAAEYWLLTGTPSTPRGACGYFATTTTVINQAYLRSAVAKAFFDAVFVNGKRTFGQACEAGRIRVFQMYPYQGGDEEYCGFTTLGDPEMNLWTAVPKILEVTHTTSLMVGNDTVDVLVNYQGAPVESAYVCIVLDSTVYETGYTMSDGTISFAVDLPHPGNLDLTISGHNLHPHEATIPVITGGAYVIYNNHSTEDSLGNGNGVVENGETILLSIILENIGSTPVAEVAATIHSDDSMIVLIDSVAHYGDIPLQTTKWGMSPYVFSVSPASPTHTVTFDITITDLYSNTWSDEFSIQISGVGGGSGGEIGPDPYGYYIYDDTDTITGNAPVYNWYAIAGGPGSIISQITNDDDDTTTVALPFSFKYYGNNYSSVGICTNGFLELGSATSRDSYNDPIPSSGGPRRLLAPFWDNLNPGTQHMGHGDIYQYFDAANHRWICEFYQVAHRGMGGGNQWETFQTILLDPAYYPTPTGDGEILYQYAVVTNAISNSVGMEDHTESRGLEYVYNSSYDPNAATLTTNRAILITTRPPESAQTSPWIYFTSYVINDSTGGNNNGIVEPGETIHITITLENGGDTLAGNVIGILRSDDADVTLGDTTSSYGDIVPGGSAANNSDPYSLTISASPLDSTIGLLLHVTANNDLYQTDIYFTLYLLIQPGVNEHGYAAQRIPENKIVIKPNPYTHASIISFVVPAKVVGTLRIYNTSGRFVREFRIPSSPNFQDVSVTWDGLDYQHRTVAAGIYFVQLELLHGDETLIQQAKLIKLQ